MGELHKAASQGHDHTVLELLKQGVDINIKDDAGRTPLHLAARKGLDDTVECLVKQGADIFITDNHGMTPLHLAAKTARVKVIEYLVGKEADIINIQDLDEQTALHIAASKGRDYTVKCLVKQGANIRIKDKNGRTPLDVADEIGNVEIAEFLREFLKEAGGMMTYLHLAVERGHMNTVKYLVNKGADINTKDDHGWTPLHIAAREGYDSTVEYLAERKADINIKDDYGRTPLHIAAAEGYGYTVENLLCKGADIHIKDKQGMTTLHVAAERGRFEIVKYLVGKGAGIDTKDDGGWTPLHTAAREGCRYTVECLVEEGADISIRDNLRKTPLDVAAEKDHVIIVEFLRTKMTSLHLTAESTHVEENFVSQGVDTSIQDHNEPTSLNPLHVAASQGHNYTVECLLQQKVDVNIKDNNGWTALHLAAREGRDDTVEYLVKQRANITKDKNGMTPLHLAAERARVKVVNYLADKEANIINIQDWDGQTALHIAASKNHDYTVKCLVEQGANISIRDKYGRTPMDVAVERGHVVIAEVLREAGNAMSNMTYLHLAVEGGHMNTVKYLVDKGADINTKDDRGWTPLHMAASEGYDSTVEYLAEKGANINSKGYDGWTPLHVAAVQGYEITVKTLVSKNADINIKDIREMTPLHVAAGSARFKIVEYLVDEGANISTKDSDGRTPLHTAAGAGYRYTVEYLVKKGADITIKDNKGKTPLNLAVEEGHMNVSEFLKGAEVYHRRSMKKRPGPPFTASYLGPPFTAAGSGKEKDKQIPTKYVETVSEQVRGIAQQKVPAAPTILAVEATSSTSLSVKWAACSSDGGSPITGYVVEYYGESDPGLQTQVFASNVLFTILDQLTPSTEYNVMVSVENAVGRSGPSVTMRAKTKVDVKLNYEREMRYGHIASSIAKVLLFGIAGSGKTSATAILMGKDPPSIRTSTPLMTRPVQVLTILIKELTKWEKKTPEEVRRIVAEIIRSRELPSEIQEIQELAQTDSKSRETSSNLQETTSKLQKTHLSKPLQPKQVQPQEGQPLLPTQPLQETYYQPKSKQVHPKEGQAPKPKSKFDLALESVMKEDDFVSIVHDCNKPSKPILEQRWLYIIDSGGQPEFHDMLSIFVQKATACIFVCRMHDELDDYPPVDLYKDDSPIGTTHKSRLTNRQLFQRFMCTMRSFNFIKNEDHSLMILRNPPRILLLATHRDLVEGGELPTSLVDGLKAIALPQFKEQLIYYGTLEKFIFTMNAKNPEDRDKKTADEIRKVITDKCPGEEVNLPIRWYNLDHQSRRISDHLNRKVLSREEYGMIAKKLHIDKDSCEGALEFFNNLNTIFYLPKVLRDVVFLEPQILLNLLNELVAKKYQADEHAILPKESDFQYHDVAQVTKELLNEFKEHYHPPLFTEMELAKLFENLLIFGNLGKEKWFVPSVLPSLKREEVEQYRISKEKALVIHFPDGGPQNGIFCSTVSYLLSSYNNSPCPWEVLKDADKPKCLKRNVILFTVGDFPGKVILIEEWTHFEIHLETRPAREGDLWKLVYKAVFEGLAKAAVTHHYSNSDNVPLAAIRCPKQHCDHPSTPHPATIDHEGNWTCTESKEWYGQVPPETIPWLVISVDPPQITHSPEPRKDIAPRSTVRFTVTATGGADLTYKWQWNGADLDPLPEGVSGDTTRTLQINNVKKSHQGDYTCIVSNAAGPTTSERAQLTILDPPQITHGPAPQKDVVPGSTVRFTVTATGGGELTYKWQQNGTDLDPLPEVMSGETTRTLQIDNVKKSHQGDYTCIVSNTAGPTASERAQLTVLDPPQITHGPEPQKDIVPGSTVRFTVSATGGGDLTYKWQQNGADLDPLPGVSGDTTSTLQINNVKKSHQGDYTCIVSNAAGPTTSERAQLTILDPPQITHGPEPQKDIVPGSTVRFTVTATGGGDLTYKWQQNGADLDPLPEVMSGETTHTLQIDNVKKSHQGDYTCIVSYAAGPTASERAQLTVRPARPSGVHVKYRKSRSFTIKWDNPSTDQGVVQHLVCYKLRGDNWQQARERIAHAQSQVTIMGLLPNQQYDVRVYAMNANGRSEPNDLETMTRKTARQWIKSNPKEFAGIIVAIVTVIVPLIVGVISLIAVYRPSIQPDPGASGMAATD